jgi:hypothetical protein
MRRVGMSASTDWREEIAAGERERFEEYAALLASIQEKRGHKREGGDRALHAKSNLGVVAKLEVLPNLPPEAAQGMFATPRTYDAVIRYSNGTGGRQSDRKPDVRGFALKVIGVEGKKIIEGMENARTQDFLAVRTAALPVRDPDEFIALVRSAANPALAPFKLVAALGVGRGLAVLRGVIGSLRATVTPLAATTYYSAAPIRYGPYAVHYGFFPHDAPEALHVRDADTLGDGLAARLRARPVVYDLRVQHYEDATTTPIEDASVEWKAPFVTVATLTLPVQDPRSRRGARLAEAIERMSFDPWHAREDHRPLGSIMRARNHAYRHSTIARQAAPEPEALPDLGDAAASS